MGVATAARYASSTQHRSAVLPMDTCQLSPLLRMQLRNWVFVESSNLIFALTKFEVEGEWLNDDMWMQLFLLHASNLSVKRCVKRRSVRCLAVMPWYLTGRCSTAASRDFQAAM